MWSDSDGTVPGHRIRRKEEEFVGKSIREHRWGYMWRSAVCERGGNRSNAQSRDAGRRRAEGAELPGEVFAGIPCSRAPTLGQQRLISVSQIGSTEALLASGEYAGSCLVDKKILELELWDWS